MRVGPSQILLAPVIVGIMASIGQAQTAVLPVLPATFVRSEDGQSTIRAVRLKEPLTLNGRLDEAIYNTVEPATGFLHENPISGEPAKEQTQVWVFFDDRNVYVALRCLDSQPDTIVANEMRRDAQTIWTLSDNVIIIFDTFYDRRSGFAFQTNPLGAVRDALVTGENSISYDWNTVWDVRSQRFDRGWSTEISIPFKSLRYPPTTGSTPQVWGFAAQRMKRGTNEQSTLAPAPSTYNASSAFRLSSAATLVGIEPPGAARNLELKPSLVSSVTTNRATSPPSSNQFDKSLAVDAKYGLTNSLTADFTYNTDFAQVEIDEQQVNLTRFSLFFPEKRDFFLEGQGVFDFAGTGGVNSQTDVPILFFSRRIGLNQGQPVPIRAGGRLTGRVGRTSIGFLNIGTAEAPAAGALGTNFLVTRIKRDIWRRSNIGLVATRRTPSLNGRSSNAVFGVDANLALFTNVQLNSYYARSTTTGLTGDEESYRGQFRYVADRYGLEVERMKIGAAFNPEVGYVRRPGVRRTYSYARFSPRPTSLRGVRKFGWDGFYDRFVLPDGSVQSRLARGAFRTEFDSGDSFFILYNANYEVLQTTFRIASGVALPQGRYRFNDIQTSLSLGPHRSVSGTISASKGEFYSGDHTSVGYGGRLNLSSQLAMEPRVSVDWVSLPQGDFTTTLAGARTIYTVSPRMFVSALVQYNSSLNTLETNARLRWEYQPGSDLYVVFTDGRDTADQRLATLVNRGFAVKFTRLFRF